MLQEFDENLQVHLLDRLYRHSTPLKNKCCCCKLASFKDMQLESLTPVLGWSANAAEESVSVNVAARPVKSC